MFEVWGPFLEISALKHQSEFRPYCDNFYTWLGPHFKVLFGFLGSTISVFTHFIHFPQLESIKDKENMDQVIIRTSSEFSPIIRYFPHLPSASRSQVLWALAPRAWLRLRALASLETEARPRPSLCSQAEAAHRSQLIINFGPSSVPQPRPEPRPF